MNGNPLTSDWYYFKQGWAGGQQAGPVSWEQLATLAQTGGLAPADMVWHGTLPGWTPAVQIPNLFAAPSQQWQAAAPPAQQWQAAAPAGQQWQQAAPAGQQWQGAGPARAGRKHSLLAWVIPLVVVLLAGAGVGLYFGLKDGDDTRGVVSTGTTGSTTVTTSTPTTSSTPGTTVAGAPGTWLVMLYQDADDEILEEDMTFDLNEAEMVGSTENITIVAQLDRYSGGYEGDGDVTSTKRYRLTQDFDLYTVASEEVSDLGEADMGDGQTLYDFIEWGITTYPAEHYVLILSDHGSGWAGGWSDDDPEYASGLTMQEIDDALGSVVADTGIGGFELVGFDACLMGQLEVMSAVAPHAKYAVASEETEPSLGWSYAGFLQALADDPAMTGRELGQAIVDTYIAGDIRVTDGTARDILTGGGYTAEEVVYELSRGCTLSTIDLSTMEDLNQAVNDLAVALSGADQEMVAEARAYAQAYTSIFSEEDPPSFIDLGHFVDLLIQDGGDALVTTAAENVKTALATTVTAEAHGEERPGSSGLSIYFPNSSEYSSTFGGWMLDYPSSVGRFATASLWDDFLTYHYTGADFAIGDAYLSIVTPEESTETDFSEAIEESAPEEGVEIVGPGAGGLTIAPISISDTVVAVDGGLTTLTTQISGSNIAYVYYYVSYYWEGDGSFLTADMGYVEPGYVKEISGVFYPDWGDGEVVDVEWTWDPTLFYMSDGNDANDQFAFFEPTVYGESSTGDVYTVRGTYTFLDTGTEMDAEIDFNGDGDMLSVWGFEITDENSGTGVWHEIVPKFGDTFNITDEYLEFDENPDGEFVDYYGGTMTFGDTPFTMVPYYAYPGDYVVGIGVEDLDGNITWEFVDVTLVE